MRLLTETRPVLSLTQGTAYQIVFITDNTARDLETGCDIHKFDLLETSTAGSISFGVNSASYDTDGAFLQAMGMKLHDLIERGDHESNEQIEAATRATRKSGGKDCCLM